MPRGEASPCPPPVTCPPANQPALRRFFSHQCRLIAAVALPSQTRLSASSSRSTVAKYLTLFGSGSPKGFSSRAATRIGTSCGRQLSTQAACSDVSRAGGRPTSREGPLCRPTPFSAKRVDSRPTANSAPGSSSDGLRGTSRRRLFPETRLWPARFPDIRSFSIPTCFGVWPPTSLAQELELENAEDTRALEIN